VRGLPITNEDVGLRVGHKPLEVKLETRDSPITAAGPLNSTSQPSGFAPARL